MGSAGKSASYTSFFDVPGPHNMPLQSQSTNHSPPQGQGVSGLGFCYEGVFHGHVIETLLRWVENMLDARDHSKGSKKRAFRCAVEVIQNLAKHGRQGKLACTTDGDGAFLITSLNAVNETQRAVLQNALQESNRLPLADLREQRLEKLAHGSRTEKGGAGLGLLDLRTCSEDGVYTEFIPCEDNQIMFLLRVKVHLKS